MGTPDGTECAQQRRKPTVRAAAGGQHHVVHRVNLHRLTSYRTCNMREVLGGGIKQCVSGIGAGSIGIGHNTARVTKPKM